MKTVKTIFILLISILVFSGCQATPEKPAVINKGDNKLQETIQSTPVPTDQGTNTNQWVQSLNGSQWTEDYGITNLECNINAQITLPNTNIFPVYKVTKRTFDSDTAGYIIKYFTPGATGVRVTSDTKEELEEQLILAKKGTYVEDDKGGRWESYDGQQQDIANLEEKIKNQQSEAFNSITYDSITLPVNNTYAMPDGSREYVNITDKLVDIYNYKNGCIQPESLVSKGGAYAGEPAGTTLKKVKISKDEAMENVNNIITNLGIKNMGVAEVEKARIINIYTLDIPTEGWYITLTRNDGNSIPVNLDSSKLSGMLDFGSEDYTERWMPEMISIFVDETGIRSFSWFKPLEVVDVLNTNVSLLSFEDIKDRIRENIKFAYSKGQSEGWLISAHKMAINNIILTNVLVPIKDDLNHQMLLPAWVVYYTSSSVVNGKEYKDPIAVFAVNAIDGSSIDLVLRAG